MVHDGVNRTEQNRTEHENIKSISRMQEIVVNWQDWTNKKEAEVETQITEKYENMWNLDYESIVNVLCIPYIRR